MKIRARARRSLVWIRIVVIIVGDGVGGKEPLQQRWVYCSWFRLALRFTCIRMNDVANRMYWIYCVGFVFIGFIEYQGQIVVLKSNILKRSFRISLEHKSHRAQFTHQRNIFTHFSSPSGYAHRSRHFRFISSTETLYNRKFVVSSRRSIERKLRAHRNWFLVSILAFFSLYYLFAGYMCL